MCSNQNIVARFRTQFEWFITFPLSLYMKFQQVRYTRSLDTVEKGVRGGCPPISKQRGNYAPVPPRHNIIYANWSFKNLYFIILYHKKIHFHCNSINQDKKRKINRMFNVTIIKPNQTFWGFAWILLLDISVNVFQPKSKTFKPQARTFL